MAPSPRFIVIAVTHEAGHYTHWTVEAAPIRLLKQLLSTVDR